MEEIKPTEEEWQCEPSFDQEELPQDTDLGEKELAADNATEQSVIEPEEARFPSPPPPPPPILFYTQSSEGSPEEEEEEIPDRRPLSLSLTEQLSRPVTLRAVQFVPRDDPVVATPDDELRLALRRKASQKLEARQKDVEAIIERLDQGYFAKIEELDVLLRRATEIQNQVNFLEYCKSVKWPMALIEELKIVVSDVFRVRRNITNARKLLQTRTSKPVDTLNAVEEAVRELMATDSILQGAEERNRYLKVKVEKGADDLKEKSKGLITQLVEFAFDIAFQQQPRLSLSTSKFDREYKMNAACTALKTAARISVKTGIGAQRRKEAEAKISELSALQSSGDLSLSGSGGITQPAVSLENNLYAACAQGRYDAVKKIIEENKKRIFDDSDEGEKEKEKEDEKEKEKDETTPQDKWRIYLSTKDERGRTPLAWAVIGAFPEIVLELVKQGADTTAKDDKGNTYLHIAMIVGVGPKAEKGLECAKALLTDERVKAAINEGNNAKETALHCACRNTNMAAISLLLEHEANPEALDQFSRTPLQTLTLKAFKDVTVPPMEARVLGINFANYLHQTVLSDVTFVVPGKSFPAHKIILCAQSSIFQSMLETGQWKENDQKEITIEDVSATAFSYVLEFLYTGDAKISVKNEWAHLLELLAVSNRFLLDPLKKKCEHLLSKKIDLESAFSIYTTACDHNSLALQKGSAHFILENYSQLSFADEGKAILLDILNFIQKNVL